MNPPETSEERTKTKILGNPEPSAATTRQGQKEHFLKVWPMFFDALLDGSKSFEVRKNDRDFRVGDTLDLHEFVPASGGFTGRAITRQVTYILEGSGTVGTQFGVQAGYVVMGLASSVGQGTEEQPTPPVTKNQSLADILNEIEEHAKGCGGRGYYVVPNRNTGEPEQEQCRMCFEQPDLQENLVKALRLLRLNYRCLDHHEWRKAKIDSDIAAILTSPENGEQQSLGKPGAV